MKLKLMPILIGGVSLTLAATPLIVKAVPITSGQQLLAQEREPAQPRQGRVPKLHLTQEQKDRVRELREESQRRIEEVLTSEQRREYEDAMQNRQERMPNDRGDVAYSGAGNRTGRRRILDSLNLSQSQKDKIQEIRRESREEMRSILTDEQREQLQPSGRSMRNQDQ